MEDKKYIEIFNKYYKNAVDIEGIKFKLIDIKNPGVGNTLINEQLVYRMLNKDDLSYNTISLVELIQEKVQKFNRLFSLGNFGFDKIEIENGCWIGARTTIMGNTTVMKGTIIGASSLVIKDIPANVIAAGIPAKIIKNI